MKDLATYAIEKYGMHIVLDLHALPGGVNWLEIGEAHGHGDWFYNEQNLELSYQAVGAVLDYIQNTSEHPGSYTLDHTPLHQSMKPSTAKICERSSLLLRCRTKRQIGC